MKGEYTDEHVFTKYPPPHLQHQHPPVFPTHSFPLSPSHHSDTATPTNSNKQPNSTPDDSLTGTVEFPRRPRGRPPGSKNKPKPPVYLTREPQPLMAPHILELPTNSNIVQSLTRFTRRRGVSICVLAASGAVSNVTLKQPSTGSGGMVTFHGTFDILALSAVVLVEKLPFGGPSHGKFGFSVWLGGPQGQIVGGKVFGPLVAAGTVYIVATSFNSPTYHCLPTEDQEVIESACGDDAPPTVMTSCGGVSASCRAPPY